MALERELAFALAASSAARAPPAAVAEGRVLAHGTEGGSPAARFQKSVVAASPETVIEQTPELAKVHAEVEAARTVTALFWQAVEAGVPPPVLLKLRQEDALTRAKAEARLERSALKASFKALQNAVGALTAVTITAGMLSNHGVEPTPLVQVAHCLFDFDAPRSFPTEPSRASRTPTGQEMSPIVKGEGSQERMEAPDVDAKSPFTHQLGLPVNVLRRLFDCNSPRGSAPELSRASWTPTAQERASIAKREGPQERMEAPDVDAESPRKVRDRILAFEKSSVSPRNV